MFKNRHDAGQQLARRLDPVPHEKTRVIVSLLRGGVVVGQELAATLNCPHLPLAVSKIGAPYHEELAVGAVCFDVTFLDPQIAASLRLDKKMLRTQINKARVKFASHTTRFDLNEDMFEKLEKKVVVMTDDGVATGATVRAAYLFLKSKKPKRLILAVPVAPADFDPPPFDEVVILHKEPGFAAVSQYYEKFPQLSDEEVKKILGNRS